MVRERRTEREREMARRIERTKAGFRIYDSSPVSDWLTPYQPQFDWLRAPSDQHRFENPSKFLELIS